MKVEILNLEMLFTPQRRYEIPLFQRRYVWEQEKQWDPLWEDVRNTAERVLEDDDFTTSHFLGAVVIQPSRSQTGRLSISSVVDGQQRLITMQLLLDAVQKVFQERNHSEEAEQLQVLVQNNKAFWSSDNDRAFKVWPTTEDQDAFRDAMHDTPPSDEYKDDLIVQGHKFFKDQISYWLNDTSEQTDQTEKERAEALQKVVFELLQIAVIDLDPEEEPHVIYETLNARGTPLLQSELIKNMLLYEAGDAISDDSSISHFWGFDSGWWRVNIRQGRIERPRIDAFLNYWLVMRRREEVAHNSVFSNFRSYFRQERNSDALSVAADLKSVGEAYRGLEESEIPGLKTFLYRRNAMQAGVTTPVLMWLVSSGVSNEQMQKATRALDSYLVRRMICRLSNKNYNLLFLTLIGELQAAGSGKAGDTVVEYLKEQTAPSRMWPDDQALSKAFHDNDLFRMLSRGTRLKMILEGIEEGLWTNKTEGQSVAPDLTIEHIMPQKWGQNWELPKVDDQTQAKLDREHLIHTIGNLTLVNDRLNPTLSNRAWEDKEGKEGKRKIMHNHSNLFLNKEIVKAKEWNEERIKARTVDLCKVAIKVWPHADGIA